MAYAETVERGDGRAHGTTPFLLVKEKKNQIYFPCTRRWGIRKRVGLEASCDAVVLEPEL